MKRAALCAPALLAVAVVAGCGGSAARSGAPPVTNQGRNPPAPLLGSLVVEIRFVGGPDIESRRLGGGRVVIFNGRQRVGAVDVKPGHHARIRLRPGRYSLGLEDMPPTQLLGCAPKIATVRAGRTTHYTLSYGCSIP